MVKKKNNDVRIEVRDISDADNPPDGCPHCNSTNFIRHTYYLRDIQDLGLPNVKKFVRYETVIWKCKDCNSSFAVKHPEVLDKTNYMPGVKEYVRERVLSKGDANRRVLWDLNNLHNVDVTITTINKWINKNATKELPTDFGNCPSFQHYSGTLSYDGTFKAVKSKKNETEDQATAPLWLRLTHLPDGRLVAYWREVKMKKNAANSLKN